MASGWMIGVMVERPGESGFVRHYYAVGQEDRARAEWAAVDAALTLGRIATSPVDGYEPVQAVDPLPPKTVLALGLRPGQVRALGDKWPRRWLGR